MPTKAKKKKRILITGATGLLGQDLAKVLSSNNRVTGLGSKDLDIADQNAVHSIITKSKPDILINCAALVDVDACQQDPEKAVKINGVGVKNLVEMTEKSGIPICHISTDYVFDGKNETPYRESDPVNPINIYGVSKLMGERYIQQVTLKYFIIRTSMLYGTGKKNFVDTTIEKARSGEEIKAIIDQSSTPTNTLELAQAISMLLQTFSYGIYHITNSGVCSRFDLVQFILHETGLTKAKVTPVTMEQTKRLAPRPPFLHLNIDAFENTLGRKMHPWQDALKSYLNNDSSS